MRIWNAATLHSHSCVLFCCYHCLPLTQVSEVDWYLLEYEFKFYAKPYFLTITFPGLVVEDGTERAQFDPVEGGWVFKPS